MKKVFVSFLVCLFFVSLMQGTYVGKVYFKQQPGDQQRLLFKVPRDFHEAWTFKERLIRRGGILAGAERATSQTEENHLAVLNAYFAFEEMKGNLRIRLVQDDPEAKMEHRRYSQYYKGLEVFGGEIIKHYKEGTLVGINGEYYEIEDFDTTTLITKEAAIGLFEADLEKFNLIERVNESKLIIFPIKDRDYRLAYQVVLEEGEVFSMTGIISASTGEVLLKYSNIQTDDLTIGKGIGYHGDIYKFPTTLNSGFYWLFDESTVRPVNQYTYVYDLFIYPYDNDNYWDADSVLVNVHTYAGWTYDYYYLSHGRQGIDGNNMNIRAVVHALGGTDNANWHPSYNRLAFYDPGIGGMQTGAALDVVAHEYSHGVTQYTSNLVYANEPGALNESFSDIMGTAVEFYWQPEGSGFDRADWICGEDAYAAYGNFMRNLSNPNSKVDLRGPDPCHLSQFYSLPNTEYGDWGGVHKNSTIYSHAFYLLANGGTNNVSGKSVSGIGIEKAIKIFYRAWTYYMVPSSNFLYAANALLQSAYDLYGSGSNEYAQTIKAMEAIGWIVK
jgi:Zn-dependent metalloprotease